MTTFVPGGQAIIDASPGDELPAFRPFVELGASGLRRTSGYVDEEFLPALRGRKADKIFREMSDNNSVIGGWYGAVTQLLRQIEWPVEPGAKNSEARKAAQFLEECLGDMERTFGDIITEISSFMIYGWELSEMMFKRRRGPFTEGRDKSKYDDGLIGFADIAGRAQETRLRWVFDENGKIMAMVQQAPPRYEKRVLPMSKCLLFRTTTAKNNPEGRSLLRNCYEPWYYLKRHQEIEAVGVARDLTGVPMAKVPSKLLQAAAGTKDGAMLDAIKKLVTSISRNEQEGIVWPYDVDSESKLPEMEFSLVTSGGSRQFDTEAIITRYKTEILQALNAAFMMMGQEGASGAYNMHTDKSGLFRTMINALAEMIADVFNRQAIPLLFKVNNWKVKDLPKIVPNPVDPPDLTQLGGFLTQLQALGVQLFPDPVLEKFVRDAAGLPQLDKKQEEVLAAQQKQAQLLALAQQRMEAIQLDQQVRQGEMGIQQQGQQIQQGQQQMAAGPQAEQSDPNDKKRSDIGVQTDKVKLAQEKQKLTNLKTKQGPASKPSSGRAPTKKAPIKKAYVLYRVKETV